MRARASTVVITMRGIRRLIAILSHRFRAVTREVGVLPESDGYRTGVQHDAGRVRLTRAAVEALFADRVDRLVAPSTVYAVFTRDGIVYSSGFGEIAPGRTPTADTAYRIASCTKSFTAAALLILVESGKVSLDE